MVAMCTTVTLPTGEWLHTPAELRAHGWHVLPDDAVVDPDDPIDDDECLCGVDVEAVLRRHGVRWTDDTGGAFLDVVAPTESETTS